MGRRLHASSCFIALVFLHRLAAQDSGDEEDCPYEQDIESDEAPNQDDIVGTSAKALQAFLSASRGGSWVNVQRLEIGSNESSDEWVYSQVSDLLTSNRPVVLSGVALTQDGLAKEKHEIWKSIRRMLKTWRESAPDRLQDYWRGQGLGRCESQAYDTESWGWPFQDKMEFTVRDCGAFGSYGGEENLRNLTSNLDMFSGPGVHLHFDSDCEHSFAVQVMGSKLYWIQGPDPNQDARGRAKFAADFYARNKMKPVATPSDMGMWDYVTVLSPGDILLYNLWMPHNGIPVRGHDWSFNGNFRFVHNTTTAEASQPSHLRQLCEMKTTVEGFQPGVYPQVQPWDDEWDAMASEIRYAFDKGKDFNPVIFRWTHIWRNRVCRGGRGQAKDEVGGYRDARCAELPPDPELMARSA